jgi:3-oxoadipate enol-lactonase
MSHAFAARQRVDLFYNLTGPDAAPVVAFSNSIGTTVEMWDAQVRALSSRFRCLRYDTRGHGRSQTLDQPVTMDDLADDLAGLLDGLGIDTAHVVGLSLGGMTAQAFAVRHAARLDRLVLMATSAYLQAGYEERAALVREKGLAEIVDVAMTRWFTPAFMQSSPEKVAHLRDRFLKNDPRAYAACCSAIHRMDLRASNAEITAPTLIIAGSDDPATPPVMMEEIRSRSPNAELVILPRTSHISAVENPRAGEPPPARLPGRGVGRRLRLPRRRSTKPDRGAVLP